MIAIVIPTLNEEENIGRLIQSIQRVMVKDYCVVVVDDNSSDQTQEMVKSLVKAYPVKLLARPRKMGLASAVMDGIASCPTADAYIVMDADYSHPPTLLYTIRERLEIGDIVIASRYVRGGGTEGWSIKRKVISNVARMMASPLTPVRDSGSGFFGIRRSTLMGATGRIEPTGYKILLEILVKCSGYSWIEVPYIFKDREIGQSKLDGDVMRQYIEHLRKLYSYKQAIREHYRSF